MGLLIKGLRPGTMVQLGAGGFFRNGSEPTKFQRDILTAEGAEFGDLDTDYQPRKIAREADIDPVVPPSLAELEKVKKLDPEEHFGKTPSELQVEAILDEKHEDASEHAPEAGLSAEAVETGAPK